MAAVDARGQSDQPFFNSLFDLSFRHFITPRLIRVLFILSLIVIGLTWLGFLITGFMMGAAMGIVFLVGGAIVAFVYVLLARVGLELVIVVFRISEDTDTIARQGGVSRI